MADEKLNYRAFLQVGILALAHIGQGLSLWVGPN